MNESIILLIYTIGIVILITIFQVIGQNGLKNFGFFKNSYIHLFIAFVAYFIISYLLSVAYNFQTIGFVNNLWAAFAIVVMTIFGYYVWNETVTQKNVIGLLIILSGVILLLYESCTKNNK